MSTEPEDSSEEKLGNSLYPVCHSSPMDRDRPYNEQAHTIYGKRGKTLVEGLTYRDVMDCLFLAICDSFPGKLGEPKEYPESLWECDHLVARCNAMCIAQNLACWLERYQGIYPNVPDLRPVR